MNALLAIPMCIAAAALAVVLLCVLFSLVIFPFASVRAWKIAGKSSHPTEALEADRLLATCRKAKRLALGSLVIAFCAVGVAGLVAIVHAVLVR
jgi:hypothetical protein